MELKERALLWSGEDFDRKYVAIRYARLYTVDWSVGWYQCSGVFYHLGTMGGRREFRNPAEDNLVLVTSVCWSCCAVINIKIQTHMYGVDDVIGTIEV
jgi:hypothetical protein